MEASDSIMNSHQSPWRATEGIVFDYATRIDLFGLKDELLEALNARNFSTARTVCQRAMGKCVSETRAKGVCTADIPEASAYRRLLHLAHMVDDLAALPKRPVRKIRPAVPATMVLHHQN